MKSLNDHAASLVQNRPPQAHASVPAPHTRVTGAWPSASSLAPTPLPSALPTTLAASDRLLRLPDVLAKFPVGRSTWYAGMRAGRYPKPVRISQRAVGWSSKSIDALIAHQVAQVCRVGLPFPGA